MSKSIPALQIAPDRTVRHQHPTRASAATEARYACTMHPEVVRDAPGACPKCGMTLVRV